MEVFSQDEKTLKDTLPTNYKNVNEGKREIKKEGAERVRGKRERKERENDLE